MLHVLFEAISESSANFRQSFWMFWNPPQLIRHLQQLVFSLYLAQADSSEREMKSEISRKMTTSVSGKHNEIMPIV